MASERQAAFDSLNTGMRQHKQPLDKAGRLIDVPQPGPQLYKLALAICEDRRSTSEMEALEPIL